MGDEEQQSSRGAKAYAGWEGRRYPPFGAKWEELLARRRRTTWGRFTWISPSPLLASINDKIVKGLDDGMVNDRRARWVAEARKGAGLAGDFTVEQRLDEDELSFLVIGDTGEQDASQYATVAPIQAVGDKTDFAVIASDVIYPAGDVNDYIDGFYLPYEGYRAPIYAIPGNHDWYDGLNGFMFHFCNVPPLAPIKYRAGAYSWRERVARALWRHPSPPEDRDELIQQRSLRAAATGSPGPVQPGPYYAIDTKHLRIVCIDTGITGKLDREQGEWLVRVSKERKCDKVLITGKPIYVNGRYEPGPIDRGAPDDSDARDPLAPFASVDDVVRHPDHRYVAAIGGDVHNYQHYPVRLEQEDRGIEYLVSGGGGAYLGATHPIDRIDIDPGADGVPSGVRSLNEQDVTLYPLRGDSLTRFIVRFAPMLGLALLVALVIVAGTAAAFVLPQSGFGERVGVLAPGSAHDPPLWAVMLAGPATLVGVVVLGMASRRIGGLAPFGYRTFTMLAIAALLVFLTAYAGGEQWPAEWPWIWRMAVSTLLAVVVPAAVLCGYYLLKDWIPAAVRVALACAPALAFGVVLTAGDVDGRLLAIAVLGVLVAVVVLVGAIRGKDHVPLDATAAAAAAAESAGTLAPQRAAVATFLHRLRSPAARRKLRLRAGRLLPPAIAGGGVLALLIALPHGSAAAWLPAGVLWASLAIWSLLACALILANLRALPALLSLSLFRPYVDADEVARWVAKRLGISQPVRATPGDPERRSRTELLAKVTYFAQPFKRFMSELAEATAPPFFKSFLRVDVDGDRKLTITCFGVTGLPEHEDDPSIEHVVGPIALREAQPPPGRAQPAGQPRYSSSYSDSRASSAPRLA